MKRRLFTILSALSLLLCVGVGALWVRSHFRGDSLRCGIGGVDGKRHRMLKLQSHQGTIDYRDTLYEPGIYPAFDAKKIGPHWETWHVSPEGDPLLLHKDWGKHWAGFALVHKDIAFRREVMVAAPHWSIVLPCTLLPAFVITLRLRDRRRRKRTGLCPACRYDLRATPDKCPECGTIAAAVSGRA